MVTLPSGTVTFFFSDIEGSTRLIEAAPEQYPELLDRHRQIVREALARSGGHEVNTEGDSFFAVFERAADAVGAAVDIQRQMTAEPWPQAATLRVRIGLHSGEGLLVEDDYVGLEVHRAARIMAAAHGGQVLLSETTRSLSARNLGDVEVRDLGEHSLRDLSGRERLFQAWAPGVADDRRPPRTLDTAPNNLPTLLSVLVGREREQTALRSELDDPAVRLLTLVGPGGIGKTRLALQAAADKLDSFKDGVHFVDLAAARDHGAAMRAIVEVVGAAVGADEELRAALVRHLRPRQALLVLDNFEQLVATADDVVELLRECTRLKVMVTSREGLRVRGERLFPLETLSLPAVSASLTAEEAARSDSVRLFVERAREGRPEFVLNDANAGTVADICRRLDGLPLAIELAAARLRLFSVEELGDRLGSRLDVLRGGARDLPERQRTLRGAIEWSYELLDNDERAVFGLLSIFPSARVAAVEDVASRVDGLREIDVVECLASLVDKSMARRVFEDGDQRLAMLNTMRDYASDWFASNAEVESASRRAHATYYTNLAEAMRPRLRRGERETALDELGAELGNLQAAWRTLIKATDIGELTRLFDPLWILNESRGWYHELVGITNDLLGVMSNESAGRASADDEITLRLVLARGLLALRGYSDEVEQLYRDALALSESGGSMPKRLPVLRSLASFHLYRADLDKALAVGWELLALAQQEHDPSLAVEGHLVVGPNLAMLGNPTEGLAHLERAISLFDPQRDGREPLRLGPNPGVAAHTVSALVRWLFGYPATADRLTDAALELAHQLNHPYSLAYASFHAAVISLWNRQFETTRRRASEAVEIALQNGYRVWQAVSLVVRGVAEGALGDPATGLAQTEQGIALYEDLRTPPIFWPMILGLRAQALGQAQRHAEALTLLDRAIGLSGGGRPTTVSLGLLRATALEALGDPAGAETELWSTLDIAHTAGVRMVEVEAATQLVRLETAGTTVPGRDAASALRAVYEGFDEGLDLPLLVEAAAALGRPDAAPVETR